MECKDISAETLYDVLHDIEYRKKWDTNVIETFDIGKLTVNSDVGYYAWKCPKPLKNRDVITLRSWLPMGADYIIMNYSVKHPKYPPRKDLVRAVSIQTGYLIQGRGVKSCSITYLAQVDPKGSLPKWVVNKSSQFLAPKAMKKMYKACLKYPNPFQALAVPRTEHPPCRGALGPLHPARRLAGEHRRKQPVRDQRRPGRRQRRGQCQLSHVHFRAASPPPQLPHTPSLCPTGFILSVYPVQFV
uniref:START domain-containing protein 10 n=1 Tax=Pelodiscus sinensis TaxID=13735 RepID=K7FHQ2_PELSI